jgi:hypothetical protein
LASIPIAVKATTKPGKSGPMVVEDRVDRSSTMDDNDVY